MKSEKEAVKVGGGIKKILVANEKLAEVTMELKYEEFSTRGHTPVSIKIKDRRVYEEQSGLDFIPLPEGIGNTTRSDIPFAVKKRPHHYATYSVCTIQIRGSKDAWELMKHALFLSIPTDKPLTIERLVTKHNETGFQCVWERERFVDRMGQTKYRLILTKIRGVNVWELPSNFVKKVGEGLAYTTCRFVKKREIRSTHLCENDSRVDN